MKKLFKSEAFAPTVSAILVFSLVFNLWLGVKLIHAKHIIQAADSRITAIDTTKSASESTNKDDIIKSLEEENKKLKADQGENKKQEDTHRDEKTAASVTVEKFIKEYEQLVTERPDRENQIPRFKPLATEKMIKQLFPDGVVQNQMADKDDYTGLHTHRSIENIAVFTNADQLGKDEGKALAKITIKTTVDGAEDRKNVSSKLVEFTLKKDSGQLKVDSFVTNYVK